MIFSIIIPTYNRTEQLRACLLSLYRQQLPVDEWEIIVVDDGGKEDVASLVAQLRLNCRIRTFRQQNSGPAKARNFGAAKARGHYLAFLDDDCEADVHWLSTLKDKVRPGTLIGGRTVNKLQTNICSEASQLLVDHLYKVLSSSTLLFFTSNNFVVDRQSFLASGEFHTGFARPAGEDREFCIRYSHLGFTLHYAPDALIYHSHKLALRSFIKQHFTYGRSTYVFRKLMKQQQINLFRRRHFVSVKLLFCPLQYKKYGWVKMCALMGLMLVSQLSYATGAIFEILFNRIKHL